MSWNSVTKPAKSFVCIRMAGNYNFKISSVKMEILSFQGINRLRTKISFGGRMLNKWIVS
jgi:hypothetical protein